MGNPLDRHYEPPMVVPDADAAGARRALKEVSDAKIAAGRPRSDVGADALQIAKTENWSRK